MDKNAAMIAYLQTCPAIVNSPLYFNFIHARNDNKQIITLANDKIINKRFIDGSVLKTYAITVVDFKSSAYNPIIQTNVEGNENVEDMDSVQEIIDWIEQQDDLHNYPDFGADCIIESIGANTENPVLDGIDTSSTPILTQYSVTIEVTYLDKSRIVWG